MKNAHPPRYARHRFPAEVISYAVWLYFRFPLSLRMVEEMLTARGIEVSYETVRQWERVRHRNLMGDCQRGPDPDAIEVVKGSLFCKPVLRGSAAVIPFLMRRGSRCPQSTGAPGGGNRSRRAGPLACTSRLHSRDRLPSYADRRGPRRIDGQSRPTEQGREPSPSRHGHPTRGPATLGSNSRAGWDGIRMPRTCQPS